MNALYLLYFTGLISITISLPTKFQENTQTLYKIEKPDFKFNYDDFKLNPSDITIKTSTNWTSSLNITGISLSNDPNETLVLYYNVSQMFEFAALKFKIGVFETRKLDVYEKKPDIIRRGLGLGWNFTNEAITVKATLLAVGRIERNVDFTDLAKRSYINYNVSFVSFITITYPNETTFIQKHPELEAPQMLESPPDIGYGDIPLVNATGVDETICIKRRCQTSTEPEEKFSQYTLFNDIDVINSVKTSSDVSISSIVLDNGRILYTRSSSIDVQFKVSIGEHRC